MEEKQRPGQLEMPISLLAPGYSRRPVFRGIDKFRPPERLLHRMRDDLGRLYDAHAPAVFAYLLNATRDYAHASDILQEVFMKVAERPEAMHGLRSPRGWLIRAASCRMVDAHRQRGREEAATAGAALDAELFTAAEQPDERAFDAALADALGTLPEEQRAVVHLKIWEDMTFAEIAEALGISANTAASRYRYALGKLEGLLRPLHDKIL
jgi:RNA polymerase sigma-70 factor, ECF subfamily